MASETELVNVALYLVGAGRITSFDGDTSKPAVACQTLYPRMRDRLLAMYRWNCNMTRAALGGANVVAPVYEFTYSYNLPGDILRLWETNIIHPARWVVEGKTLLTDETDVKIRYGRRLTTVDDFTEGLRASIELLLAAALAMPIARKVTLRDSLLREFSDVLLDALATESQENKPSASPGVELISPRLLPGIDNYISLDATASPL